MVLVEEEETEGVEGVAETKANVRGKTLAPVSVVVLIGVEATRDGAIVVGVVEEEGGVAATADTDTMVDSVLTSITSLS